MDQATGYFTKTVSPCITNDGKVFAFIRWGMDPLNPHHTRPSLSITGVIGPKDNGDAGSCGQISLGNMDNSVCNEGWTTAKIQKFFQIWEDYHLNDMKAGTPLQQAWLKTHKTEFPGYPTSHYDWATQALRHAGLNPDNTHLPDGTQGTPKGILGGYLYGHAWTYLEVPQDVIAFLQDLPENWEGLPTCWFPRPRKAI